MVSKGRPTIALIDDDKIFQFTAQKILQATSLTSTILQFENAPAALEYLKENAKQPALLPDFIFLDINMPQIDGWMFLEDFESIKTVFQKSMVIYMVSSSIDPSDIRRARRNANVKDYVTKPLTREKFIELLQPA